MTRIIEHWITVSLAVSGGLVMLEDFSLDFWQWWRALPGMSIAGVSWCDGVALLLIAIGMMCLLLPAWNQMKLPARHRSRCTG